MSLIEDVDLVAKWMQDLRWFAESKYLSKRCSGPFVLSLRDYIARDDDIHVICTCLLVCERVTIRMQGGYDQ
jgi:hypothetical protein